MVVPTGHGCRGHSALPTRSGPLCTVASLRDACVPPTERGWAWHSDLHHTLWSSASQDGDRDSHVDHAADPPVKWLSCAEFPNDWHGGQGGRAHTFTNHLRKAQGPCDFGATATAQPAQTGSTSRSTGPDASPCFGCTCVHWARGCPAHFTPLPNLLVRSRNKIWQDKEYGKLQLIQAWDYSKQHKPHHHLT